LGVAATPIERLTTEAAVSNRALYEMFDPPKEQVLLHVIEHVLDSLVQDIQQRLPQMAARGERSRPAWDDLSIVVQAIVTAFAGTLMDKPPVYRILYLESGHVLGTARPDPLLKVVEGCADINAELDLARPAQLGVIALSGAVSELVGLRYGGAKVTTQEIGDTVAWLCSLISPLLAGHDAFGTDADG
jgi:hypothetical protein